MGWQPAPNEIYETFKEYAGSGRDFIYLAFSKAMSGTYNLAQSTLNEIKEMYPKVNMEAIDTKSGSAATGLIALQAVRLDSKNNLDFNKVMEMVKELIHYVEHIFTIPDLNWLVEGGRIGKTQGMLGNILNINRFMVNKIGSVLGSHLGIGGVGIFFFNNNAADLITKNT